MTLLSAFARLIIRWELLWLLLLAPLLFFPEEGRGIVIAALPLLWAIRWVATRHMVPRTPLDGALLLLLLMVAVSLWATFDPVFSMPKVTGVLLGVAFYYALVARAGSRRGLLLAFTLFIAASCAIATISLFTTNWTAKFPGIAQALAFLPSYVLALPGSPPEGFNPNGVAGALLFAFPLLLVLAWPYRNPTLALIGGWPRWFVYLLVVLLFGLVAGTLGLTQSRGGYLGALVGVAALFFLPHRRLLLLGVAAALIGGVLLLRVGTGPIQSYFDSQETTEALGSDALNSLEGRLEIWSRAIYGIQDFPFTGMGMGTFRRVVPILYPLFTIAPDNDIGHAHNHLLAAGVDLGIPGLVAYLALWLGAGAMLWQVWRLASLHAHRMLALGLAAGLLAQFTWGLTDANVLGSKAGFPFWLALGCVAALHHFVMAETPPLLSVEEPPLVRAEFVVTPEPLGAPAEDA